MDKLQTVVTTQPLAVAALAYGAYSALGRWKNIQDEQGCPKCEITQGVLGLGLALFAGAVLVQAYRKA